MFYIIHILVGILIGIIFNNPLLIIPIAFLSHFIIDMIPHWDGDFDKRKFEKTGIAKIKKSVIYIRVIDSFFSIILLIYFLYISNNYNIIYGAFFSLLPDVLKIGYLTPITNNKYFKKYLKFHSRIQKDINIIPGLIIQAIFLIILIILIIKLI